MTIQDRPWSVRSALERAQGTRPLRPEEVARPDQGNTAPSVRGDVREPRSILPYKRARHDIKRQYGLTLQLGFLLSLALVLGFFRAPMQGVSDFEVTLVEQEHVELEEIRQTKQDLRPPPPPRPPVPIEVPNDVIVEDVELDLDASLDLSEQMSNLPPPPSAAPTPTEDVEEEEAEIFVIVEQMPEIIGGIESIYNFLTYPEMARKAGLEGLVVVQVVVETDGMPTDPIVVRSPGAFLDQAAVEAVMQLRFKPGMQRGKPVRVRFAMPVRFRLDG